MKAFLLRLGYSWPYSWPLMLITKNTIGATQLTEIRSLRSKKNQDGPSTSGLNSN